MKRPMVPMFSIQSPIRETLNPQYNHPLSVNNKIYSNLMTPLTKTLYAFGESLESPHKNYLDFQQKILKNPRMLKKIDFDNNDLMENHHNNLNNRIKNENQSVNLKIRNQFFNHTKNDNKNLRNISNFNEEEISDEKKNGEKKTNLTPEFKK